METVKSPIKSLGVWGSVLTIAISLGASIGWWSEDFVTAEGDTINQLLVTGATLVSGIIALIGRWRASSKIVP